MAIGKGSLSSIFKGMTDLWFNSLTDELLLILKGGDEKVASVGVRRKLTEFRTLGKRLLTSTEDEEREDMKKFKSVVENLTGIRQAKQGVKMHLRKKGEKFENMIKKCLSEGSGGLEMASVSSEKV